MAEMETPGAAGNVFTPEYLEMLARQDEPGGSGEGEMAGPWRVVESEPGRWDVVRFWAGATGRAPRISATDRETALLFAATLPSLGRPPFFRTYELGVDGNRFVESEGRTVAEMTAIGEEAVAVAHVAACLVRSPWALALILQAAGPTVQREVGEILFQGAR